VNLGKWPQVELYASFHPGSRVRGGLFSALFQGLLKKSIIHWEHNKMVLDARSERGLATQNHLTPFIPLKGDNAPYHRCEYGKWH